MSRPQNKQRKSKQYASPIATRQLSVKQSQKNLLSSPSVNKLLQHESNPPSLLRKRNSTNNFKRKFQQKRALFVDENETEQQQTRTRKQSMPLQGSFQDQFNESNPSKKKCFNVKYTLFPRDCQKMLMHDIPSQIRRIGEKFHADKAIMSFIDRKHRLINCQCYQCNPANRNESNAHTSEQDLKSGDSDSQENINKRGLKIFDENQNMSQKSQEYLNLSFKRNKRDKNQISNPPTPPLYFNPKIMKYFTNQSAHNSHLNTKPNTKSNSQLGSESVNSDRKGSQQRSQPKKRFCKIWIPGFKGEFMQFDIKTIQRVAQLQRAEEITMDIQSKLNATFKQAQAQEQFKAPILKEFEPFLLLRYAPNPIQKHLQRRKVTIDALIDKLALQARRGQFSKHRHFIPKISNIQLLYLQSVLGKQDYEVKKLERKESKLRQLLDNQSLELYGKGFDQTKYDMESLRKIYLDPPKRKYMNNNGSSKKEDLASQIEKKLEGIEQQQQEDFQEQEDQLYQQYDDINLELDSMNQQQIQDSQEDDEQIQEPIRNQNQAKETRIRARRKQERLRQTYQQLSEQNLDVCNIVDYLTNKGVVLPKRQKKVSYPRNFDRNEINNNNNNFKHQNFSHYQLGAQNQENFYYQMQNFEQHEGNVSNLPIIEQEIEESPLHIKNLKDQSSYMKEFTIHNQADDNSKLSQVDKHSQLSSSFRKFQNESLDHHNLQNNQGANQLQQQIMQSSPKSSKSVGSIGSLPYLLKKSKSLPLYKFFGQDASNVANINQDDDHHHHPLHHNQSSEMLQSQRYDIYGRQESQQSEVIPSGRKHHNRHHDQLLQPTVSSSENQLMNSQQPVFIRNRQNSYIKSHTLDQNDNLYGSDFYNQHHDTNEYLKKVQSNNRIIDIQEPYMKSHFYPQNQMKFCQNEYHDSHQQNQYSTPTQYGYLAQEHSILQQLEPDQRFPNSPTPITQTKKQRGKSKNNRHRVHVDQYSNYQYENLLHHSHHQQFHQRHSHLSNSAPPIHHHALYSQGSSNMPMNGFYLPQGQAIMTPAPPIHYCYHQLFPQQTIQQHHGFVYGSNQCSDFSLQYPSQMNEAPRQDSSTLSSSCNHRIKVPFDSERSEDNNNNNSSRRKKNKKKLKSGQRNQDLGGSNYSQGQQQQQLANQNRVKVKNSNNKIIIPVEKDLENFQLSPLLQEDQEQKYKTKSMDLINMREWGNFQQMSLNKVNKLLIDQQEKMTKRVKERAKEHCEQTKINTFSKGEKIKIIMDKNKKKTSIKQCLNSRDDNLSRYFYANKKKQNEKQNEESVLDNEHSFEYQIEAGSFPNAGDKNKKVRFLQWKDKASLLRQGSRG